MAKFKNILEYIVKTEKMTFLVMFSLFALFLLWRHYQAEFVYPQKLYEKRYKENLDSCVTKGEYSKEACIEQHSLYSAEDYRKYYRRAMEGHDVTPADAQIDGFVRNYIKYLKSEKYQYERCLNKIEEGKIKTEREPKEFCTCGSEKLSEIATNMKPLKWPTKKKVNTVFKDVYREVRAICQK